MISQEVLKKITTNKGNSLFELSEKKTVMLVFLRHFGCIFCQKAMIDLSERKEAINSKGIKLVLVHMTQDSIAEKYFERFGVAGVDHISDPECESYKYFGLAKGNFNQLFGLRNWVTGFELFVTTKATGSIRQIGDGFQMPGIFILRDRKIVDRYIHKIASDEPDYDALIECCVA